MKKKVLAAVLGVVLAFFAYVTVFDYVNAVANSEMVGVTYRTSQHHKFQTLFCWWW